MRRPPRRIAAFALASLALLVPACGGSSGGGTAEPGHVNVVDNAFKPSTIEVSIGDTVTWDFKGGSQHNVTADTFKSVTLGKGKTFTHTFNSAGTFSYTCTLHTGMTGKVKVS